MNHFVSYSGQRNIGAQGFDRLQVSGSQYPYFTYYQQANEVSELH